MSIFVKIPLFVTIFVSLTIKAFAETSANELFYIHDSSRSSKELAESIISANENGLSWANAYLVSKGLDPMYCQPKKMAINKEQAYSIMQQYVKHNPNDAYDPYGIVLLKSLIYVFPCK